MTLNVAQFIKNILEKQMKIQHFDAYVKVFKTSDIPSNVVSKIQEQFGEEYLEDSKYVVFYRGHIDKKKLKKMFSLTDKALGEDANRLVEGDFKQLKLFDDADEDLITSNNEQPDAQTSEPAEQEVDATNDDNQQDDEAADDDKKPESDDLDDEHAMNEDKDDSEDDVADTDDDSASDDGSDEIEDEDDPAKKYAIPDDAQDDAQDDEFAQPDSAYRNGIGKDDSQNIPLRFFFLKITLNG